MDDKIIKAAEWLQEQAEKYPFSEIGIKLINHGGEIKKIEKLVIEKVQ